MIKLLKVQRWPLPSEEMVLSVACPFEDDDFDMDEIDFLDETVSSSPAMEETKLSSSLLEQEAVREVALEEVRTDLTGDPTELLVPIDVTV